MTRTLLSAGVGIPVALAAMSLWFLVEIVHLTERPRPLLLRSSAILMTAILFGLIVARFAKYA